jgi:hypothetical protein
MRFKRVKNVRVIGLAISCALGGFLLAALIFGKPWHLPPDWGDIPTWLAVVVATFGGGVALSQLRQQTSVLEGEAMRNVKRDELLDGQLRDLQERSAAWRRAQADGVDLTWKGGNTPSESWAEVTNNSSRPITAVTCRFRPDDGTGDLSSVDVLDVAVFQGGGPMPKTYLAMDGVAPTGPVPVLRRERAAAFKFAQRREYPSKGLMLVRFTDDAGVSWELNHDGHLEEQPDRSVW